MRSLFVTLINMLGLVALPAGAAATKPIQVLMIVNEGFWAPEYFEPRKAFDLAGFKITVAAKRKGLIYPDTRNTTYKPVNVGIVFQDVKAKDYDAIVFAGGNGAWTDYFPNEDVHRILKEGITENKILALICSSTGLLGVGLNFDGKTPIAAGRRVTGYSRVRGLIEKLGQAVYEPGNPDQPHVVVDGKLITGRDPMSSRLFGQIVVREVKGLHQN